MNFQKEESFFENFNFTLESNITALVGPNGVGKTCRAKVLTGIIPPTTGIVDSKVSTYYFAQSEIPPGITAADTWVLTIFGHHWH